MRVIFVMLLFWPFIGSMAQVGINTENPQTELDVNGSLQLREDLNTVGTTPTSTDPGIYGQAIVSQGANTPAEWKGLKVPFLEDGQFQLINSHSRIDQVGISFPTGTGNGGVTTQIGDTFNAANWTVIEGLTIPIEVNNEANKISLIFQAGVEASRTTSTNQNMKFLCAAFFNNTLRALRADQIDLIRNKEKNKGLYTLAYTVLDLPVGTYEVKVACRKMSTTTNSLRLAIGRSSEGSGNTETNAFMMQSVLKIDVIEKVFYTIQ